MDNNNSSPMNDKDKNTLHVAGVDISNTSSGAQAVDTSDPVEEEKIVDIDGSVPSINDTDLKDSGIHFVKNDEPTINKDDLSSLAEQKKKQDTQKTSEPKEEEVIIPKPETPKVEKEDVFISSELKPKPTPVAGSDLEEEFRSELADARAICGPDNNDSVLAKSEALAGLLAKIEQKLSHKKISVKKELSNLKKMKDSISKDIDEIKNMEESEKKIKNQLDKIELIKKEVEAIEEEFRNENL